MAGGGGMAAASSGPAAVYSSENEQVLYVRDVRSPSASSNSGNGSRGGVPGALMITITNSRDPFFLYTLSLAETDYHTLKTEQRLLVDFQNFPKMITELVAECAHNGSSPPTGGQNMSVYLAVGESTVESTLSIIEANQFREITHLCLRMRKGTDEVLKHYLASKLSHFQQLAERLEETLCNTEKELRRVTTERQSQADEINLMKAERCQLEQSLKAVHERELAEISERHAREIRDNHHTLTAERDNVVKELSTQLETAQAAAESSTKAATEANEKVDRNIVVLENSLASLTRKLEAASKELEEDKERYGSTSAEVKRLEKENYALVKRLSEAEVSLALSKEQLVAKEELANKSRELLEQANQQKSSLEEQIQMYRSSLTQLEEKLSVSFKETTKGNEVIKKLQDQIKSYKSRVKGLKQAMQDHEETIHELDHRLLEEQRSHDDTKLEHKRIVYFRLGRAPDALDRAQEECDSTRAKLAEAHKLLESNEQLANNSSSSLVVGRQPAPYQSGQRLASGFTIPGGQGASSKRPNLEDISAIGFPRIPLKLTWKEKLAKILGALVTRPLVHLFMVVGQMLACALSGIYAASQLVAAGSPRVPSYFQLTEDALSDGLEGCVEITFSGLSYCVVYTVLCIWALTRVFQQVFVLPLQQGQVFMDIAVWGVYRALQ
ncbi:merozoite surface protein, putative [Perkinsus marinus ATCC 50983]|uniref:Merozoite surface protein, putative n=1 Tax=Perkinsus marinus (strain ATCC 50983 / TXsc) TaxID=423536 RepID=C5LH06_PERM5|nr:merozoite surface protein, putative [Perkinsus marinus ATCC 50983]EER03977.1 merozoite surface protein, putative [Perkinsus marinus ATCC 50983]|eukprot:XP_002772161.1 merozoite surface protein, putative [Perkinsus marinus ATCC 50983]